MRNRHSHHPPFQSTRYIFYHIKEKGRRISAVHIVHSGASENAPYPVWPADHATALYRRAIASLKHLILFPMFVQPLPALSVLRQNLFHL